ncbi:MAG: LamG domain-containing protein, partial [Candidatus Moraniibacteriota bacterium]
DGSGTSATDSSSGGNTGTLNNGPTWTTGQIGGGLDFDGSDDYVEVAYSSSLVASQSLTYSFWVRPDLNEQVGILGSLNGENGSGYNFITLDNNGSQAGNPEVFCTRNINGTTTSRVVSFPYTVSQWFHYTYTYDGAYERIYVNGNKLLETAQTGNFATNTEYGLILGDSYQAAPGGFDGVMDEVRVYTRALSSDEVSQLYRITSPTAVDTGLKGYWSFNGQDMSGGYSFDRSGAGNTGSLYNSPTIARGILGQALDFDAVNDYVATADSSSLDIGDTDDLTLSGWFYRDTFTGTNGLIAKRSGFATGDVGYIAYIDATTDQLIFQISDGTDVYTITSSSTFTATDWHHFAVVWDQDSATNSEIYIDGTADKATDSGTIGNIGDLSNALGVYVGARSDGSTLFDGRIDEARVYKRALSATDIKSLYDQGSVDSVNSSASQNQGTGRLDSALALYWALDDGTSGTTPTSATDSSTNGNTGTLTNSPTWTTGQVGNAVDFDGTDDYITVADSDILDVTDSTNFTLSGWFNRDTFTTDDTITAKSNGQAASDTGYNVYIDDSTDKLTFVANDGTDQYKLESVSTFTATGWHHYALVWDESGATQTKLYIDGVAENVTATGTFTSVNSMANSVAFRVGSESDAGNPFDGKLDEVRLYRRAFSGDEVTNLYRLATPTATDTGLNGYWSFNGRDMNGTAVLDSSGAGNNGVLTNGPTRTIGKIGQGLSFDNTDDYVSVPDNASLDIGDTDNMTLAGWFYRNATGTAGTIFAKRAGVLAANTGYIAYIALVGSKLIFEVYDGTDEYSFD